LTDHLPLELIAQPALTPQTLVDAGGESWARLGGIVARRITELAPGDILEIATAEPGVRVALRTWCSETGHVLLRVVEDGDRSSCWIRKTGDASVHG